MEEKITILETQIQELRILIASLILSDRYFFARDLQIQDGRNIQLATGTGTRIGTGTGEKLAFFNVTPVVQQTGGANLTNNVAVGGSSDTIANYTDLTTYATDAAAIRNNIYQLARTLKQDHDALRAFGLLS